MEGGRGKRNTRAQRILFGSLTADIVCGVRRMVFGTSDGCMIFRVIILSVNDFETKKGRLGYVSFCLISQSFSFHEVWSNYKIVMQ